MKSKLIIRIIASILIVGGFVLGAYTLYRSSDKADETQVFADRTLLSGLYNSYIDEYWEEGTGRTLDKQQDDITTSEGQSYTMLRAVWESDKPTFDKSWEWTQEQLQREDKLFAWRWGQKNDDSYGILEDQGGQNTASDADSDIALALLMAASRWQDDQYLTDAKEVIAAMWDEEVITIDGIPYFASNNLEKDSSQDAIINPSYFAPYAYRHFAKADPDNDWMALVDSSYDVINRSIDDTLDKDSSAGLVPDWIIINKETGEISAPPEEVSNLTTNYGYDAMRTPWRIALDYQWNDESRAKTTLEKMSFLEKEWQDTNMILPIYSHDGEGQTTDEPSETYGTAIGYFKVVNPEVANDVYNAKLLSLYDANNNTWSQPMSYYSDNWTWFGIALYNEQLPDLAKSL